MLIREIENKDIDKVAEIDKICFTTPWPKSSFDFEVNLNPIAKYFVAEIENVIVGYGGMWKIKGESHITNICVLPEYRGKKIGRKLLEALIEDSVEDDAESMTLEVRKSNFPAINLYESLGFKSVGIRPNYYKDDKEDAIIMWKYF